MSEPVLFEVAPYREVTAADVKVGDWIKGLGWPWSWKYVIRADHYPSGSTNVSTTDRLGGSYSGGFLGPGTSPVLIYNGTPPEEERAA